jgi:hypothetical protein
MGKNADPGSGSVMKSPDHICESFGTIFCDSGIRDRKKFGSGNRDGKKSDPGYTSRIRNSAVYRTDCVVVLLWAVRSHVPARPAANQSFSYKWGAAGWGQ